MKRFSKVLVCALLVLAVLRLFPKAVRDAISLPLARGLAGISGAAAFPLSEALVPVMAAWIAFGRRARKVLCLALALGVCYLPVVWGDDLQATRAGTEEVEALCRELVGELNRAGRTVTDVSGALEEARLAMGCAAGAKAARYPEWMRKAGLAGLYVPLTGEALVDATRPAAALPFTAAHELAHSLGAGREVSANVRAYEACVAQGGAAAYSARLWALKYAMGRLEDADWVKEGLDPEIADDLSAIPWSRGAGGGYDALADWLCRNT